MRPVWQQGQPGMMGADLGQRGGRHGALGTERELGRRHQRQSLDYLLWEHPRRTPNEGSVIPLKGGERMALESMMNLIRGHVTSWYNC